MKFLKEFLQIVLGLMIGIGFFPFPMFFIGHSHGTLSLIFSILAAWLCVKFLTK